MFSDFDWRQAFPSLAQGLQRLDGFWWERSLREKVLLSALLLCVLTWLMYALAIRPVLDKSAQAQRQFDRQWQVYQWLQANQTDLSRLKSQQQQNDQSVGDWSSLSANDQVFQLNRLLRRQGLSAGLKSVTPKNHSIRVVLTGVPVNSVLHWMGHMNQLGAPVKSLQLQPLNETTVSKSAGQANVTVDWER